MRDIEHLPDPSEDFRDGIDETPDWSEENFRLDFSEKPKKKAPAPKLRREQVNAKKGYRLPGLQRAYLVLEIISTNKTDVSISRKFGISKQSVNKMRQRVVAAMRLRGAKILYRKNGTLFFGGG